ANIDATIAQIKSLDQEFRKSPGAPGTPPTTTTLSPGAAGSKPIILAPKDAKKVQTISEQISAFEARRAANDARMKEIQAKCTEESRSKDDTEREEFDRLRDEVKGVDRELIDLREMEVLNKAAAKPIDVGPAP